MPVFDPVSLEALLGSSIRDKLMKWFEELKREAPLVADCFSTDEISLAQMVPLLKQIDLLYPGTGAFECIGAAMNSLRHGKNLGDPDSICGLGASVNPDELRDKTYVHMRKRQLPDWVVSRASQRLAHTYIRQADATVRPFDWCKYCRLLAVNPLGNWRGVTWLAPIEDVLDAVATGGPYSAIPAYWFYRHWLLVGLAWDFTPAHPVSKILADLATETLFVVLCMKSEAVEDARVPTVLDAYPGPVTDEYFFRPRGWWISKGMGWGGFGVTLDLSDNLKGLSAKSGAREATALVAKIEIGGVKELVPSANCGFSLLDRAGF